MNATNKAIDRRTWLSRVPVVDPSGVMGALRKAGILLAGGNPDAAEEEAGAASGKIICIASVSSDAVKAVVVTPSGFVYRFEPLDFEPSFWSFAARHYHWVTRSIDDRKRLASLTGVDLDSIKGTNLQRKADSTTWSLEETLRQLGCEKAAAVAADLF